MPDGVQGLIGCLLVWNSIITEEFDSVCYEEAKMVLSLQ